VTKGKVDKKILGNESYVGSFESFWCYVNKNGQQAKKRTRGMELKGVIHCGDNLYYAVPYIGLPLVMGTLGVMTLTSPGRRPTKPKS